MTSAAPRSAYIRIETRTQPELPSKCMCVITQTRAVKLCVDIMKLSRSLKVFGKHSSMPQLSYILFYSFEIYSHETENVRNNKIYRRTSDRCIRNIRFYIYYLQVQQYKLIIISTRRTNIPHNQQVSKRVLQIAYPTKCKVKQLSQLTKLSSSDRFFIRNMTSSIDNNFYYYYSKRSSPDVYRRYLLGKHLRL